MYRRFVTALLTGCLAVGGSLALAPAASASTTECSQVFMYGGSFMNCVAFKGHLTKAYYARAYADPVSETVYTSDSNGAGSETRDVQRFPQFASCKVHVQIYNTKSGSDARSWNSEQQSCKDFVDNGAAVVIPIYDNIPEGKYYQKFWISPQDGQYVGSKAVSWQVKG